MASMNHGRLFWWGKAASLLLSPTASVTESSMASPSLLVWDEAAIDRARGSVPCSTATKYKSLNRSLRASPFTGVVAFLAAAYAATTGKRRSVPALRMGRDFQRYSTVDHGMILHLPSREVDDVVFNTGASTYRRTQP